MKITKFGHACLLVEEGEARILIDPGIYSTNQNLQKNVQAVLITHEHQDHLHIESLRTILKKNSGIEILTNRGAGAILEKEGIGFRIVENSGRYVVNGVVIEGSGKEHAIVHSSIPTVHNTGYVIAEHFFYPGDAFRKTKASIEILALPVAGSWLKLSEAIDYALEVKPKICFPVHDGTLKSPEAVHRIAGEVLGAAGIKFIVSELGKSYEF